jgi:hypothetical protein
MDEVIYSASCPLSYVASMDEVIYRAPWRPWQKSARVPAALLQRDWSTSPSQIGTPIFFAAFLPLLHCCFSTSLMTPLVRLHVPARNPPTRQLCESKMLR